MKKKIVILGSTGSIGISTLEVIKVKKKSFIIELLSANKNYKLLIKQAKYFKPKKILINDKRYFYKLKSGLKKTKIKIYYGNESLSSIINKKVDYTMSSIVGIAGLKPTLDAIKFSKVIAIANKESIVCGWNLISKKLKKYKTKLIPVDSEHFSIFHLCKNSQDKDIEEIIITASGGPFLKTPINKLNKIKPKEAVKHPTWKMGKKISVDSANLMNKVFEMIEACKLFKFNVSKYKIMIHPQSCVHSIVRFKNGLTKMVLHEADMKIPISNSIYESDTKLTNIQKVDPKILTKLTFDSVDHKRFPSIKLFKKILSAGISAPTIINAANEELVSLFLKNKIKFTDIVKNLNKLIQHKEFKKISQKEPKSLNDINILDKWARLKTHKISVR